MSPRQVGTHYAKYVLSKGEKGMARITIRFNEDDTVKVSLSDTDASGQRFVRVAVAENRADLARAVGTLFPPATP